MKIPMHHVFYFSCQVFICFPAIAQPVKIDHYSIAVTTQHSAPPFGSFSRLFTKDFHPGLELATGMKWDKKPRHDYYQQFQLAYSFHRWVQHSLSVSTSFGYRYKSKNGLHAGSSVGAGYLYAIPDSKIFKLQQNGTYRRDLHAGRGQLLVFLGIGFGKEFKSGKTLFLQYRQRIQTPFIKSYVPVLPSNTMHLGISIPLHHHNN